MIQIVEGPGSALGLQGCRIIEAGDSPLGAVDDAEKIRADPVRTAFFEGMAGRALLGRRLALFRVGACKPYRERLGRLRLGGCPPAAGLSGTAMA